MIKKILLILALVLVALSSLACNTVKGIGRDIETAGEAVEGAVGSPEHND